LLQRLTEAHKLHCYAVGYVGSRSFPELLGKWAPPTTWSWMTHRQALNFRRCWEDWNGNQLDWQVTVLLGFLIYKIDCLWRDLDSRERKRLSAACCWCVAVQCLFVLCFFVYWQKLVSVSAIVSDKLSGF
jgi:hypothetical protein